MFGLFGSKSVAFNPQTDIPSLSGKVILVTGGNAGLGRQSVLEYARHNPDHIWIASRSLDKANATIKEIKKLVPNAPPLHALELDLSSLASVQKAARTFAAASSRLDILLLNAGIMAVAPALTKDGYEIQIGTNHVGHALLTKLLLPTLKSTAAQGADVRVVALSSKAHNWHARGGIDFDTLKTTGAKQGSAVNYGQAKLANILFARQLAKEHPDITAASVHPGMVNTSLFDKANSIPGFLRGISGVVLPIFISSVEAGAKNQLWASVSKDVVSGTYYEPVGIPGLEAKMGKDLNLAKKLWDWTEKELEGYKI